MQSCSTKQGFKRRASQVPNVVSLCIGSVAGVSAATCTFPLEVVRRRMMMGQKASAATPRMRLYPPGLFLPAAEALPRSSVRKHCGGNHGHLQGGGHWCPVQGVHAELGEVGP